MYRFTSLALLSLVSTFQLVCTPQAFAQQREVWLYGRDSNKTGKNSKVVPTDCITSADGSITCNTKIETPPGDTQAQPFFEP